MAANSVIVRFQPGVSPTVIEAARLVCGAQSASPITADGLYLLRYEDGRSSFNVAASLDNHVGVLRAYADIMGSFEFLPNDPNLADWWFYDPEGGGGNVDIGLAGYWNAYATAPSKQDVIVVLMDSGLDWAHDEFLNRVDLINNQGQIRLEKSFIPELLVTDLDASAPFDWDDWESPRDFLDHGTRMASLISAIDNNATGVAGLAYANPLWVYKIGQVGSGSQHILPISALQAALGRLLQEIASQPSKRFVVNLSLGFLDYELSGAPRADLYQTLQALESTGKCLVVAASGNAIPEHLFWTVVVPDPDTGPVCTEPVTTPNLTIKFPAAFSGAQGYTELENLVAVGASRLIRYNDGTQDQCQCGAPAMGESWLRARAEFSRFLQPDGLPHGQCQQIVDLLAPGGARTALSTEEMSCEGMNVLTAKIPGSSDDELAWGWGTSYSSAIVSAVAAGMWSQNLTLSPAELKTKLKASADRTGIVDTVEGLSNNAWFEFTTIGFCLDPPDPDDVGSASLDPGIDEVVEASGKIGAGILNAARAMELVPIREVDYITGGVLSASATFDNEDLLVLAKTLIVPQGATLTIGSGAETLQRLAVESSAVGTELVVSGILALQEDVIFRAYEHGAAPGSWLGIRITSGGSIVTNGYSLTVRDAEVGLWFEGTATLAGPVFIETSAVGVQYSGTLSASSTSVSNCGIGFLADSPVSQLTLTDSELTAIEGDGIAAFTGLGMIGSDLSFESIGGYAIALSGGSLQLSGVNTVSATLGCSLQDLDAGSFAQGLTITASAGIALEISASEISLGPAVHLAGSGAGLPALQVSSGSVLQIVGSVSVTGAGGDGIVVLNSSTPGTWNSVVVTGCAGTGLRLEIGSLSLGAGASFDDNTNGCHLIDSSVVGDGSSFAANSSCGSIVDGYSTLTLRNADLGSNSTGVFLSEFAIANLGVSGSCGGNSFIGNSFKHIVNFNTTMTVQAVGNTWKADGSAPKPLMFIGSVNYATCN